jgi:phosphatidylserine decarboxylase
LAFWALGCALLTAGVGLYSLESDGPKILPEAECDVPVALWDSQGPTLACGTDGALIALSAPSILAPGDSIGPGGSQTLVRGGMPDAMRLSLGLPIDVNVATSASLAEVPGLGPSAAAQIVAYRQAHGPYPTLDALRAVPQIGPIRYARARSHLTVGFGNPGQRPVTFAIVRGVKREWLVDVVARLPQGVLSRAWGWLARRQHPQVGVAMLKKAFASGVGIDLSEATAQMDSYPSLEALFVRKLRPGTRPIAADALAVVSPVDALVGATGCVSAGTLLQIKGRTYSLARLLGDEAEAARYEGGAYATFYLAPKDYHRIHAPVSGQVREAHLIPGALMPVFEESLRKVDELFARNERLITFLDTPKNGRVAVVKVGATLVGRITVNYDANLIGNVQRSQDRHVTYDPPKIINKGGELGAFELGSTVVLVAERGQVQWADLDFGQRVLVGQCIGSMAKARAPHHPVSKITP